MSSTTEETGWKPAVELHLPTASSSAFRSAVAALYKHFEGQDPGPLKMPNGWYDVTPQMAEDFLRRNTSNRKPSLSVVKKYFYAMESGGWMPTGQALLINQDGKAEDLQHRCLAAYFGKVSFRSFVITDVPVVAEMFAYIDDSKPRSAADALYTSGSDGQSGVIAAAIKLAWRYDRGGFAIIAAHQHSIKEMSTPQVLAFNQANPRLNRIAHIITSNFGAAVDVIGATAVAVFFGWKVDACFGADVLTTFMEKLGEEDESDTTSIFAAIRKRLLDAQYKPEKALTKPHILALLIKGFRFWITEADRKAYGGRQGLYLTDNEAFPRIEDIPVPETAEAAD